MPDKAAYPLAAMLAPFGARRDALQRLDARLAALGSGMSEVVQALAGRLNTLPAAASFQPFAPAMQAAQGSVVQPAMTRPGGTTAAAALASRMRASATKKRTQGAAGSKRVTRLPGFAFPTAALTDAVQKAVAAAQANANGQRHGSVVQAAVRAAAQVADEQAAFAKPLMPVPAELAGALIKQVLKTVKPVAQATGGMLGGLDLGALVPHPGMVFNPNMPNGLQEMLQRMAKAEQTRRPSPAKARRHRQQAATGAAPAGSRGAQDVPLSVILTALVDALTTGPRASRSARGGKPGKPAEQPRPAAPRAPTRLLAPAASSPTDTAATPTPRAAPPGSGDDTNAALDELHRALLDQAWLRGVDLR